MYYISCTVVCFRRTKFVQPSTSLGNPRATHLEFSELAISATKSRPPQSLTLTDFSWTSRGHTRLIVNALRSLPVRDGGGGGVAVVSQGVQRHYLSFTSSQTPIMTHMVTV
jgi:hypothetical protein